MKYIWLSALVPFCAGAAQTGYIQQTVDIIAWPFKKGVQIAALHAVSKIDTPELARLRLNQERLMSAYVEPNWLQRLRLIRDEIQTRFFPPRALGQERTERLRLNQARLNVPVANLPEYTLTLAIWNQTVGRCF